MENMGRIVDMKEYKEKSRVQKAASHAASLFEMDMQELTKAIDFANHMPEIEIKRSLVDSLIVGKDNEELKTILTREYLSKHIKLESCDYDENDLEMISEFVGGLYDLTNPQIKGDSYIYNMHPKERQVWVDGYNCLVKLM